MIIYTYKNKITWYIARYLTKQGQKVRLKRRTHLSGSVIRTRHQVRCAAMFSTSAHVGLGTICAEADNVSVCLC